MQLLALNDVCRISGVNPQTLRNWIAFGFIKPARPGKIGPGNAHQFSLTQTVGLAMAQRYRDEGATLDRALGVLKLIESLGVEKLEMHLEKGECVPVPAMMIGDVPRPDCWRLGMMVRPPDDLAMPPGAARLMKALAIAPIKVRVENEAAKLETKLARRPPKQRGRIASK